ncbi:MAG: helical membrane plugin domain-containing protein [Sulfuricaulis sp.]
MTDAKQSNGGNPAASTTSAEIERLVASAQDALTDDMVARLSATLSDGLDLLDRTNRSGIVRALPAITRLVENGDLDRLISLARLVAAVEDSLSDDIVNRLSLVATEMASLVDKLTRNEGFMRLIDILGREEVQCALVDIAESACAAKTEASGLPAPKGGIGGLWQLAKDPNTQDALRFMSLVSKQLRKRQEKT